jgi:hypothetical protein
MMRSRLLALAFPIVCVPTILGACGGDDDSGGTPPTNDGGSDDGTAQGDSAPIVDASEAGKQDSGPPEVLAFTTYASFSPLANHLPEGVVVINGTPIVGFAPVGQLWNVLPDGGTTLFGQFTSPSNTFTLGMTINAQKDVFVAVAQTGASPSPAPGVYKFAPTGGAPGTYSTSGAAMGFANGIDIVGTDTFVSDSAQGKIFRVAENGVSTEWKADPVLEGDLTKCNIPNPFPVGVNGISHDDAYIYGVNLDKGIFFRIKRNTDGSAGAVEKLFENCDFAGADGVARDTDGTFIVANNPKNRIDRVTLGVLGSANANYKTIGSGAPLDGPASVFIDGVAPNKKLWITNSAFGSAATEGGAPKPSLVSAPLK